MSNDLVSSSISPSILAQYEVAVQVTRSTLQQVDGLPFYVEFQTRAIEGKKRENSKYDNVPYICDVLNLETGELQSLVMNKVLHSTLNESFPDGSYVGRKFAIAREKAHDDAKRYKIYKIFELKERAAPVIEGERAAPVIEAEVVKPETGKKSGKHNIG